MAAAVQFSPRLFDRAANLGRILALTEEALAKGADLVVLPEMATSGYCFYDPTEVLPLAEPIPGPTTEALRHLLADRNAVVVVGLPEVDPATGVLYNTAAVVGPTGVLGRYRKVHSFVSEPRWAMDGDLGPVVVDTPVGRVGVLICMDIEYEEVGRSLQRLDAEVLAFPTNWVDERCPSPTWWARARELGLPLVAANRVGVERGVHFTGGSAIFASDGTLLASIDDGEGVILAALTPPRRTPDTAPPSPAELLPFARSTHLFDPHLFFRLYGRRDLPTGGVLRCHALRWQGKLDELGDALPDAEPGDDPLVLFPGDALREAPPDLEARLVALAARHHAFIAIGITLADAERLLLVGPQGILASGCRAPGASVLEPLLANVGPARVALVFGRDLVRPETSRLAALAGADVLLAADGGDSPPPLPHPGSQVDLGPRVPAGPDPAHYFLPRVRAATDDLYVLFASAHHPAAAFEPTFDLVGKVSSAGVAIAVDTRAVQDGRPNPVRYKYHLTKRRPDTYRVLWSPSPVGS
jgi:predicted amidohydrolase